MRQSGGKGMNADAMLQVVRGSQLMEGAGVRICRTVGTSGLRNLVRFPSMLFCAALTTLTNDFDIYIRG